MTEDDVRSLWHRAWFGYLLLLAVIGFGVSRFGVTLTSFGWGLIVVILLSAGYWLLFVRLLPLPHLVREERDAVVTGLRREEADEDTTPGYYMVVDLTVTRADGSELNAELADLIADRDLGRFAVGTQWKVYLFRDAELAVLTERHDDVWRHGHVLQRVIGWTVMGARPQQGSTILTRRFRID